MLAFTLEKGHLVAQLSHKR